MSFCIFAKTIINIQLIYYRYDKDEIIGLRAQRSHAFE